jgi:1-acyl-sn-glycerol-3-phosphate acyltransferase
MRKKKRIWVMKSLFIPTIAIGLAIVIFPWLTFGKYPISTIVYIYIGIMVFLTLLRSKDSWFFETNETFDQAVTLIIWAIALPVFTFCGILALVCILCSKRSIYVVASIFSFIVMYVLGIRLRIVGELPQEQFIGISNHCSWVDDPIDPLVMGTKPWKVVYAEEVQRIAFARYFLKHIGIPISRKEMSSRIGVAKKLFDEVKRGYNVLVFPEGKRLQVASLDQEQQYLLEFNNGPFHLSKESGVPILPVVISWTFLFKPRSGQWWYSPCTITIYYLEPVTIDDTETVEGFKRRVWNLMFAVLEESIDD